MEISLIALDLDDTLLHDDLTISETNRAAIRAAEDAGIEIVIASGRNYHAMKRYVEFLDLDRPGNYLICSNGAETIDAVRGEALERLMLTESFCHEAAALIESRGFPWQVYMEGKIYCSRINPWAMRDEELSGLAAIQAPDKSILFKNGQIKFVIPGEPEKIAELYANFLEVFAGRAEIVTSKPYFLEILPLGANKGAALARLSARIGIPMERMMAIGDAMNDLGMVSEVGWGCAPANALDAVKKAARIVSEKTNDQDAVADLILSYALPGITR
jgi:Cof subfamily protein (haloacid dehalogenase superfamily)